VEKFLININNNLKTFIQNISKSLLQPTNWLKNILKQKNEVNPHFYF